MAEVSTGLHRILAYPLVYRAWYLLVGGQAAMADYVASYLKLKPGDRLLDIGCGPATLLNLLPGDVDYVGFDVSERYVEAARRRYGDRGQFIQASVGAPPPIEPSSFDIVSATGILHHLDDEEVLGTLKLAHESLKPDGRLITLDPALGVEGQPRVARWLIEHDRGRNVRPPERYLGLARSVFGIVEAEIRHDRLNIPYTHFIMQCRKA
ncbi:MAG: class I SAM-dependent methyltransferase [Methyloceanibacter sp.]|uniref:class I SAM-dependent methyltransferase n=1 Tax=Methyloceanibacter sp. TaxID=1965321 RepID=UPI003D6CE047